MAATEDGKWFKEINRQYGNWKDETTQFSMREINAIHNETIRLTAIASYQAGHENGCREFESKLVVDLDDALGKINELQAENERLRKALDGISCMMPNHCPHYPLDLCPVCEAKKALEGD